MLLENIIGALQGLFWLMEVFIGLYIAFIEMEYGKLIIWIQMDCYSDLRTQDNIRFKSFMSVIEFKSLIEFFKFAFF